MKALKCEMCGSNDVVKQEGFYVCQNCGTKYSVEEAKKLMIEGTVDVKGTVKVDTSDELKNLYEIARRAVMNDNSENAAKFYEQILLKDPNSWEANFYSVYFNAKSCVIAHISMAADSVKNCLYSVLKLIQQYLLNEEERSNAIIEITDKSIDIARLFFYAAKNHYDGIDPSIKNNYVQEYSNNVYSAKSILNELGDNLDVVFDGQYSPQSMMCWKEYIDITNKMLPLYSNKEANIEDVKYYENQIKKYDSTYQLPTLNNSNGEGCYVATAVYGSYNCPEVWTLRRYRDNILDATWYGRAFIQTYYAISPTLVKWFGETSWFKRLWRRPLDKLVTALRCKGVEDTPYQDKY